jgi:RNA polymerase sigma-70 factor (ECF subfamily)
MSTTAVQPPPFVLDADLIRRHQRAVWRFLRFLGCSTTDADDLTQETFLAMLRRPPADRTERAFAGWLRTTAHNLYRQRGRRLRRDLETMEPAAIESGFAAYVSDPNEGDTYMTALQTCLGLLDERARHLLALRYRDGLARKELALELGMEPAGVKTLLRRLKEKLRDCVERRRKR